MKELASPLFGLAVLLAIVYAVLPFANLDTVGEWILVVQLIIGIVIGFALKHEKDRAAMYAPLAAFGVFALVFPGFLPAIADPNLQALWQLISRFLGAFVPVFTPVVALAVLLKDMPEFTKA